MAITLNQCYCIRRTICKKGRRGIHTLLYVLICISLNRVSIGKIAWYVTGRKSNVWKIERKSAVICEYKYSITRLLMPGLLAPTVHQQPSHYVGYARETNHFILRGVISNTCITSLLRNFRIYIYILMYTDMFSKIRPARQVLSFRDYYQQFSPAKTIWLLLWFVVWLQHDDVFKWKHFPRYWPFVRGIHRSPVNSPHIGQWRGALMFSLICALIYAWVNNR